MSEEDDKLPDTVENFHTEEPEVWGPTKPPRLALFGRRYERCRGIRYRMDANHSPIGFRIDKFSRRYFRRGYARRYGIVSPGYFREKPIQVEVQLDNTWRFKALARENAENSHEAKRLYEKDRAWRAEQRKKLAHEDWEKRTKMGEKIRPLGVMPTRSERRKTERMMSMEFRKQLAGRLLEQRMEDVIGAPPSPPSSVTTTDK